MRRLFSAACVLLVAGATAEAADPLARARQLYNQGQFTDAIVAADGAKRVASRADSADLIAARAYLEAGESRSPSTATSMGCFGSTSVARLAVMG